jgi:hypothetical protein
MRYALLPVKIAAFIIEWTVKAMIFTILLAVVAGVSLLCIAGAVWLTRRQGGMHLSWIQDGSGSGIRRNQMGYRWRESVPIMSERINSGI